MVHLDGVVADTRGSRNFADLHENVGGAKSLRGEALTEYMIMLTVAEADCMESTTTKRNKTNINARVV